MIKFLIAFGIIAAMVATYVYLDWGFVQILGVAFVLAMVDTADKRGPVWRRGIWITLVFSLLVLGHFVIDDYFMYWGALLLAGLLFIISIALLYHLINPESGIGSVLTAYFIGLITLFPVAVYVLYVGMKGLEFW